MLLAGLMHAVGAGAQAHDVVPAPLAFSLPLNKSPGPVPDDFGSKRQIERELQRQDPYNYFLFEVEATNVR